MADAAEWIANSNDAVEISLEDGSDVLKFHPKFTYPIFGEEEAIVGYKGLKINIRFDAKTLLPLIELNYEKKLTDEVQDPLDRLKEFIEWESNEDSWLKNRDQKDVLDNLELLTEFQANDDETYQLFKTKVVTSDTLHKRLRIFVLFFIEAGSYIDVSDDRWELYILRQKKSGTFAGFSTVYPYFWYKDASIHDSSEKSLNSIRKRISQFVVLPPFQGIGLGSKLYILLMNQFLEDTNVKEITVEDPNEDFDDLRDRCDLERLAKAGVWTNISLPADPEWIIRNRDEQKMAPRQFDRCLEMAALHNSGSKFGNKKYRLAVKKRIYIRNREALAELDRAQKYDKLQETYQNLVEDYHRIMDKVDFSRDAKGKRKLDQIDEED